MKPKRIHTQFHLEGLVEALVEKYPLPEKLLLPGETAGLADALKIPCLIWDKGKSDNGYGKIYVSGVQHQAHRWAYWFAYKRSPGELNVCHACDNPCCVNPHHLFLGTQKQNLDDMRLKGRAHKMGAKGEANSSSIYSSDAVREMRARFGLGAKIRSLQDQFGGSYQSIHAIVHWRTWKHLT